MVLLKSFIRNLDSPTDLQVDLQEVRTEPPCMPAQRCAQASLRLGWNSLCKRMATCKLRQKQRVLALQVLEHNTHLQQELARTTIVTPAPASTAMQLSLLRAALEEANYRLTAAGLLPVAATSLQEEPRFQASTFFGVGMLA